MLPSHLRRTGYTDGEGRFDHSGGDFDRLLVC